MNLPHNLLIQLLYLNNLHHLKPLFLLPLTAAVAAAQWTLSHTRIRSVVRCVITSFLLLSGVYLFIPREQKSFNSLILLLIFFFSTIF